MKLTPVILDFETFWSTTHTLSKMNPIAYCLHPETELISLSLKLGPLPTKVFIGEPAIKQAVSTINWSNKMAIAHNMSGFDSMLLAWRCGARPAAWGCTLAMAKPIHGVTVGGSLKLLAKHYGLGNKPDSVLESTKGRHLKDFTSEEIEAMRVYNTWDTDTCASLFKIFRPLTAPRELKLIDMTTRMLVDPAFEVDTELLITTLGEEKVRMRAALLALASQCGMNLTHLSDDEIAEGVRAELASTPKFAAFLKQCGVEPPTKESPSRPGVQIYALSKTDQDFVRLLEHEDSLVAAAAAMRLDVKSTILESRIESFLEVADATGGRMPIAKNYYGAHTGRWSGSMNLNQENLPRVDAENSKPSDALRKCLRAPKGHKVIVADLSGIELRVNHFLWKVPSSMALFQKDPEKADLYVDFARKLYEISEAEVNKHQRQVGKVAHLGLGFGAGSATFRKVAKTMGRVDLSSVEAEDVVSRWRGAYPEIVRGWRTCHAALAAIYNGAEMPVDPWGLCHTSAEGIHTPRGLIRYPGLHQEMADGKEEWWYGEGRNRARIYAGKVTENIVQHLARNVLADDIIEIKKRTGVWPVHLVHDEAIYVMPEEQAQSHLDLVQDVMRTPPEWWPELVVASAGDIADTYGDAK